MLAPFILAPFYGEPPAIPWHFLYSTFALREESKQITQSPYSDYSHQMHIHRTQILAFPILFLLAIALGCSGPGVRTGSDSDETELSPFVTGRYIWIDQSGASLHDLATGEKTGLGAGGQVSFSTVSPDGAYIAIALTAESDSRLLLIDAATRGTSVLNSGRADLVYTGVWSPSGEEFVYGYYQPAVANDRPILGQGDIKMVSLANSDIVRLGCSASRAVVAWPRDDELIVRSTDNLYRISTEGCATLETIDIRRWHTITGSPDGSHIAYIYRELAFNRDTREYEPDSALYVIPSTGGDGVKVVGDRYRPRNMAWSPDGSEIAFDVRVHPDSEKRAISVYILAADESTYLSPPTESGPSQSRPGWGPEGSFVSFVQNGNQLVVRTAETAFYHAILLGDEQRRAKSLVAWLGAVTALVTDATGSVWLYDMRSQENRLLGIGAAIGLARSK